MLLMKSENTLNATLDRLSREDRASREGINRLSQTAVRRRMRQPVHVRGYNDELFQKRSSQHRAESKRTDQSEQTDTAEPAEERAV